jgi:hypothetical protein
MLTIKCAACRRKLWKYEKFGKGEVLRCYKNKVARKYEFKQEGDKVLCVCGNEIGINKGKHIKMIKKGFTYTGTKRY